MLTIILFHLIYDICTGKLEFTNYVNKRIPWKGFKCPTREDVGFLRNLLEPLYQISLCCHGL